MAKKSIVIDDNANNLLLEKDLLLLAGFEVFTALNATEGIALVKKEKPDIIIMDVRLPDMVGTDIVNILREDKKTIDIPIIFVTASIMQKDREQLLRIPNSGLIIKPIDTRTFAKQVSEFIK